ncbi:MAG: hypothetical protein RMM98_15720 [Acidobacteriota bacterium]|nr:DUF3352 domain-containing protein [Blastocatellia bacterium]MDW8241053.1 hypothetical protein [Acidobacteriota bacterium]
MISVAIGAMVAAFIWRAPRKPLSRFAPEQALAYVEIEDPNRLVRELSSAQGWQAVARQMGWPSSWNWLNALAAAFSDHSDWQWLLSARLALVITGLEIDSTTLTPHWCLMIEPDELSGELQQRIEEQTKSLANRVLGQWTERSAEHAGRIVHSYNGQEQDRRLVWCSFDDLVLAGNHPDSIRRILDTYDQKQPSLERNPTYQRLRAIDRGASPLFGYVSTHRIATASKQIPWLDRNQLMPERLARLFWQTFFSAFDISLSYRLQVQGGTVVERIHVLNTPGSPLASIVSDATAGTQIRALALIPADAHSLMIIRPADLEQRLQALDDALKQRLSAFSHLALRETLARLKLSLGLDRDDTIADAVGNEIAIVETARGDFLLIVQAKRKGKLAALVGKYLQRDGAALTTIPYRGVEIYRSSIEGSKACCFVDDLLVIGSFDSVKNAIDAHQNEGDSKSLSALKALIEQEAVGSFEISARLGRATEAMRLAALLHNLTGRTEESHHLIPMLRSLPPTIRTTRAWTDGVLIESKSALGELVFMLLAEALANVATQAG